MKTSNEIQILKEIKEMGGRFKISHASKYDGRRQTSAIIKVNDTYYLGHALISKHDNFCRRTGREIALGRALINAKEGRSVTKESLYNFVFKEDKHGM